MKTVEKVKAISRLIGEYPHGCNMSVYDKTNKEYVGETECSMNLKKEIRILFFDVNRAIFGKIEGNLEGCQEQSAKPNVLVPFIVQAPVA